MNWYQSTSSPHCSWPFARLWGTRTELNLLKGLDILARFFRLPGRIPACQSLLKRGLLRFTRDTKTMCQLSPLTAYPYPLSNGASLWIQLSNTYYRGLVFAPNQYTNKFHLMIRHLDTENGNRLPCTLWAYSEVNKLILLLLLLLLLSLLLLFLFSRKYYYIFHADCQ